MQRALIYINVGQRYVVKGTPSVTWCRCSFSHSTEQVIARVAREMVQRAGVDVEKLIDLLVRNASAELTTYYYASS